MACFAVPLAEGLITTGAVLLLKNKKDNLFTRNLGNLQKMLYGGSFILAIEHIYHGEVVLYPPFLTAMNNPEEVGPMLHEMATVGSSMAAAVTLVWALACMLSNARSKKMDEAAQALPKKRKNLKSLGTAILGTMIMFTVDIIFGALA